MSLLLSTALQKLIRNMVINIGKSDSSMNNKVNSFHYQLVAINGKIVTFNRTNRLYFLIAIRNKVGRKD